MKATWRCGVCENINQGERTCAACGADLTRRSTAATVARARLAPPAPPLPEPAPLSPPLQRAINRHPIPEEEWEEIESDRMRVIPVPGGCIVTSGPSRSPW